MNKFKKAIEQRNPVEDKLNIPETSFIGIDDKTAPKSQPSNKPKTSKNKEKSQTNTTKSTKESIGVSSNASTNIESETKESSSSLNDETDNVVTIVTSSDVIETQIESLDINIEIQSRLKEIEDLIIAENSSRLRAGKKLSFQEKYPIMSIPARKEFHDLFNYLAPKINCNKYQLFEEVVLLGLKNLKI